MDSFILQILIENLVNSYPSYFSAYYKSDSTWGGHSDQQALLTIRDSGKGTCNQIFPSFFVGKSDGEGGGIN